jgi:hypothetical protein
MQEAWIQESLHALAMGRLAFDALAFRLFEFQSQQNPAYAEYLSLIGKAGFRPSSLNEIPFLPISLFKSREVFCRGFTEKIRFMSSGTGGNRSRHLLSDPEFCGRNSRQIFTSVIGSISDRQVIAMLPGYEENPDSSLIFMVKQLEEISAGNLNFTGLDFEKLRVAIRDCRSRGNKPLIFAVSHALLSLLDSGTQIDFSDALLIETGGMKGLRQEVSKPQLMELIRSGFQPEKLISEFGMCELSSQAYAFPEIYYPAYSLKVMVRDAEDPLGFVANYGRGALNFIDLANYASCAFIAAEDLGEVFPDGSFSVTGRLDQAEIRGCNLLFANS